MPQHKRNSILLGQDNNSLVWLIIINAIIFIALNFIKIVYYLDYDTNMEAMQNYHLQITDWLSVPSTFDHFLSRPWTIVTYMFTHESVMQLIGTVLWLWGFGYIFQDLTGTQKLFPVYIYGGLLGGVIFLLVSNLVPQYRTSDLAVFPLMGGGASVMAVALATTTLAPGYRIFPMINGGIPLWIITLIFVAVDYAGIASASGSVALAHLSGAAVGFAYTKQLQRGRDAGAWMYRVVNWINNLFNPDKQQARYDVKERRFYKASKKPFEKTPRVTQQKLDELLDKINQQGYESLSSEEKEFLKKASQEEI